MNIISKIGIISTLTLGAFASSCATSPSGGVVTNSSIKPYTKDVCIVTDNKLGSMGTPITKVYNGQEVKFCCAPCVKRFEANPEKYLAKL
ncbi:MAG: hypothetical protein ACSHX0_08395 [Akkermansiaceae bacterium]